MNAKDGILVLHVAIVLCLFLPPLAMASTEEQQTNQTKDAAQLEMEALEAEMGEEGMKKIADYLELQASLPDVVKRMPYRGLAFAATDPESQAITMGYIDNFDVSEKKKEEYKSGLQDIWDRYPENITEDDYAFMIELGPMVEKESLKKYQDQDYSNNSDFESDNGSISSGNESSKSNSTPGFGLLGSLTCLYGGWKFRKK
ncbi:hypothetical protein [Methanosarcina hadiensis]|uniref:hypothetical protein n=1 Tax=Methanosarcina hadiensis TaxID=3078083 RepID=UPI003977A3BB